MAQKSTLVVRGKVTGCAGETRGSVIYTRCKVNITEKWKGSPGSLVDFLVPGGTSGGMVQTFTGTPKFVSGSEYVLFLWAGRSGNLQVIGLSQGVFDIRQDPKGVPIANRPATTEIMLDAGGQPVRDQGIELTVESLRTRVARVTGGGSK
jgi:hypothetical protein